MPQASRDGLPWEGDNATVVVAHPDDEALWFSGIMGKVGRLIVCFRAGSPRNRQAHEAVVREFPIAGTVFLSLAGFGAYNPRHSLRPRRTRHGLRIWTSLRGEIAYRRNGRILEERLRELIPRGARVITHNPWGEYGHEEHVQVAAILERRRARGEIDLWHSNYGCPRSFALMRRELRACRPGAVVTLPTDPAFGRRMRDFYRRHGVWTWAPDWDWFGEETYFSRATNGGMRAYAHAPPLNIFQLVD